jgi:hypothetical protein
MTTPRNYTFYKFVCINDDVKSCYVGSSANMKKRRGTHKSNYHNENRHEHNLKIYKTIRENGGWGNWKIIEFATKDNITKREAEQIEEEYRVQLKADMNDQRAFLSPEQKKEYCKEYREQNKAKIAEHWKEYYHDNKAKIAEYKKEWNEDNPEYHKEYYEQNKEKILERIKEKYNCPCGGRYIHANKSRHYKSKKHCDFINSQQ